MPDRNIKITLQYDGSRYDGWQKQENTDKTIQGKLEQILEKWQVSRLKYTVPGGPMQVSMPGGRRQIFICRHPVMK